jgi:hypothetical protein
MCKQVANLVVLVSTKVRMVKHRARIVQKGGISHRPAETIAIVVVKISITHNRVGRIVGHVRIPKIEMVALNAPVAVLGMHYVANGVAVVDVRDVTHDLRRCSAIL